jgi:hypothetical protein
MLKTSLYQIEFCYSNGYLARALEQAAEFVKKIDERNVHHVVARPDPAIEGAWWVDVIYQTEEAG